ncbi:UPF0158 family protein [Alkalihalobacillus sp. MEB130]|uniref:UPF0158 family protein n=1 Tax=Alkalihalobacillus sp. MEB130 TaxID=2976704 RepID=UPI0028DFE236|nr:UPF0158 family protein [Alkalihalobacillus sp. MEB130]MDT8861811.1 UPF0158 family protein [Alkalihalobacillus sp. MEB130]
MLVKLEDILEGMEMQSEESHAYLNLETGEVVYVSREALLIAEDGEEYDHLPVWQQEEAQQAYEIVESFGKYVTLPTSFDIHEYDMLERFCYSLSDEKKQDLLLHAIRGKGAFRRFKDTLHRLGMIQQWYEYRDERYKELAREFCQSNKIDYIEE